MEQLKAGSGQEPAFSVSRPLPDETAIWLIRHGETEWSKSGQHTGRTEIALTENGVRQAEALRPILAGLNPSLVLCSPRARAQQTAQLAGSRIDGIDPDLAEWDYGDYEGLTSAQIRQRDPDWTLWTHPVPGGETAAEVGTRADRVLRRAVRSAADGPVILFSHGHMSRVMGVRWVGLPVQCGVILKLGTASTSVLGAEHTLPVIVEWNVTHTGRGEQS